MFDFIINLAIQLGLPLLCLLSVSLMVTRSSLIGIILVWGAFLWSGYWHGLAEPPFFQIAGNINVYVMDAIASVLLAAYIIRLTQQKRFSKTEKLLALFGILISISYIRGISIYGLQATTNEFRPYYYLICIAFYFSGIAVTSTNFRNLYRVWFAGTIILVLTAFFRWTLGEIPELAGLWGGVGGFRFRVLNANQTMVLGQTLLLLILAPQRMRNSHFIIIFMFVLAAMVIILQHRSVWATMMFAVAFIIVKNPSQRSRIGMMVIGGGLIFLAIALVMIGPMLFSSLDASVEEGTRTEGSTFTWRLIKWQVLLGDLSALDFAIGRPFGSSYVTKDREGERDVSPHNYYVQTVLRIGLPGLLLFILLWFHVLKAIRKKHFLEANFFNSSTISFLLIIQLIFLIPYGFDFIQAIILGLGMAMGKTVDISSHTKMRVQSNRANSPTSYLS